LIFPITAFNRATLAAPVISLAPVVLITKDPLIVTLGSSAPVEIKSSAKESSAKEVILIF
jgi:hypothetical protein